MRIVSTLAVGITLAACGGSGGPVGGGGFPLTQLMTVMSDSGKLRVDVYTSPDQPPSRGQERVKLVIRDASTDALEDGLALSVVPWMPAMGHGTSVAPSVEEESPGVYVVSNVDFFMPGTWQLRTNISAPVTDHVAPSFQVP